MANRQTRWWRLAAAAISFGLAAVALFGQAVQSSEKGVPSQGSDVCPWLNNPTASGVLGGATTLSVTKAGDDTTACSFRHQESSGKADLEITVSTTDIRQTDKNTETHTLPCRVAVVPLRAVGNWAVLCASDRENARTAKVVGQVRDHRFTVAITNGKNMKTSGDELAEKAKLIAEQVAGALF